MWVMVVFAAAAVAWVLVKVALGLVPFVLQLALVVVVWVVRAVMVALWVLYAIALGVWELADRVTQVGRAKS